MKKVIILATGWAGDYWETDSEAPYPQGRYTELPEWDDLSKNCPLPGIGRYIKQKDKDFSRNPFVYLKIKGMRYDANTKQPYFDFETLTKSKTGSDILENKLSTRKFFSSVESPKILSILRDIGEDPLEEWKKLIEITEERIDWRDYIGKYFLEIEGNNLNNDEFENRTASLLKALGFKVIQKGHKIPGEYADGIAFFDNDYGIVYDCKNMQNFFATAEDKRAINKYVDDEKKIQSQKKIYGVFIAKSFKEESENRIFRLPVGVLLYLLYKKLFLGSEFSLSPLKKILDNRNSLETKTVDNEWIK